MKYTLKLFAILKERVGEHTWEYTSPNSLTASQLRDAFFKTFPQVASLRRVTRLAVNQTFCTEDVILQPGDELALIPPVSGG